MSGEPVDLNSLADYEPAYTPQLLQWFRQWHFKRLKLTEIGEKNLKFTVGQLVSHLQAQKNSHDS